MVRIRRTISYVLKERRRPKRTPEGFTRFSGGTENFEVYVHERAAKRIEEATTTAAPNETIGWLVGRAYQDEAGLYAFVCDALEATNAKRQRTYVQTSPKDELEFVNLLEEEFAWADRLGWWHSHPFAMHVYSATDEDNQRSWAPEPYQLGLLAVMEGQRVTLRAFQGPEAIALHEEGKEAVDNEQPSNVDDLVRAALERMGWAELARLSMERLGIVRVSWLMCRVFLPRAMRGARGVLRNCMRKWTSRKDNVFGEVDRSQDRCDDALW